MRKSLSLVLMLLPILIAGTAFAGSPNLAGDFTSEGFKYRVELDTSAKRFTFGEPDVSNIKFEKAYAADLGSRRVYASSIETPPMFGGESFTFAAALTVLNEGGSAADLNCSSPLASTQANARIFIQVIQADGTTSIANDNCFKLTPTK